MIHSTKALLPVFAVTALLTTGCVPEDDPVDQREVLSAAQGVALQLESHDGHTLTSFDVSEALMREDDGDRMRAESTGETERPDSSDPYELSRIEHYLITDLNGAHPACLTVEVTWYLDKPGSADTIEATADPGAC